MDICYGLYYLFWYIYPCISCLWYNKISAYLHIFLSIFYGKYSFINSNNINIFVIILIGVIFPQTFFYNNCSSNGRYLSILKKRWQHEELLDRLKYFQCYFRSPITKNKLCQCLPYHVTPLLIFIYLFTMLFNPLWLKKKRIGGEIANKNKYLVWIVKNFEEISLKILNVYILLIFYLLY